MPEIMEFLDAALPLIGVIVGGGIAYIAGNITAQKQIEASLASERRNRFVAGAENTLNILHKSARQLIDHHTNLMTSTLADSTGPEFDVDIIELRTHLNLYFPAANSTTSQMIAAFDTYVEERSNVIQYMIERHVISDEVAESANRAFNELVSIIGELQTHVVSTFNSRELI